MDNNKVIHGIKLSDIYSVSINPNKDYCCIKILRDNKKDQIIIESYKGVEILNELLKS